GSRSRSLYRSREPGTGTAPGAPPHRFPFPLSLQLTGTGTGTSQGLHSLPHPPTSIRFSSISVITAPSRSALLLSGQHLEACGRGHGATGGRPPAASSST